VVLKSAEFEGVRLGHIRYLTAKMQMNTGGIQLQGRQLGSA